MARDHLGNEGNGELGANEWLVKRKGMPNNGSVYQMNQQFLTFHLEDKVNFESR